MRLEDACDCLAIELSASREEAQKAYRKAALRHHPDRNPNDPDATGKFQTISEAWERIQKYHENPRRWGQHADPPETDHTGGDGATYSGGRQQYHYASWEDLFSQWFGGSRRNHDYSEYRYEPPPSHKAGCKCATCRSERRREEIFAERQKAREARRREAEKLLSSARERAKDEAARTAHERIEEAKRAEEQARRREATAAEAESRRSKAIEALRELLDAPVQLQKPLDSLLDSFAALKAATDKVKKRATRGSSGAGQRADSDAAEPALTDLLARAERRLDMLTEAVEAEANAAPLDVKVQTGVGDDDDADEQPAAPPPVHRSGGGGGSRKQRKAAARNASILATQALAAARTTLELECAIEEAEQVRAAGSELAFALEEARERLERLEMRAKR
jgi:DNA repair exonuclease SbcCD ATPase subunit